MQEEKFQIIFEDSDDIYLSKDDEEKLRQEEEEQKKLDSEFKALIISEYMEIEAEELYRHLKKYIQHNSNNISLGSFNDFYLFITS